MTLQNLIVIKIKQNCEQGNKARVHKLQSALGHLNRQPEIRKRAKDV